MFHIFHVPPLPPCLVWGDAAGGGGADTASDEGEDNTEASEGGAGTAAVVGAGDW